MSGFFRTVGLRLLEMTRLIGPVFGGLQAWRAAQVPEDMDELVRRRIPPAALRLLVSGSGDQASFDRLSQRHADDFLGLAARHGIDLRTGPWVLDFGCGCGRLARLIAPEVTHRGGAFFGSDVEPRHIAWCQANLPGVYLANPIRPPLRLLSGTLDLVYAHSVITHLTRETVEAWFEEFQRLLKPGGVALITFHDEEMAPDSAWDELQASGYALSTRALEGSTYMASFATRAALRRLAEPWLEVAEIIPSQGAGFQAVAVLKRRGAVAAPAPVHARESELA